MESSEEVNVNGCPKYPCGKEICCETEGAICKKDRCTGLTGEIVGDSCGDGYVCCEILGDVNLYCGDGIVSDWEECDDENKVSGDGCDAECRSEGRIFVSSINYTGDLDGIRGADDKCNYLAEEAKLGGHWIAVLSTSILDAKDRTRFLDIKNPETGYDMWPIYNLRGELVAESNNDLWDGEITNAVKYNEHSVPVERVWNKQRELVGDIVWTGTFSNGTRDKNAVCNKNWISDKSLDEGRVGRVLDKDGNWTSNDTLTCDNKHRIYCVEVGINIKSTIGDFKSYNVISREVDTPKVNLQDQFGNKNYNIKEINKLYTFVKHSNGIYNFKDLVEASE